MLEEEGYPIQDNIDSEILMQRDAHFGGKFSFMIDYYNQEGKGAMPEIPLERILFLAHLEEKSGQDLAPLLLSGSEASRIALAREAYKRLREIYEHSRGPATLLADLILSEEEFPEATIEQIVALGSQVVTPLVNLMASEEFADPLFPGYGHAPELAAICLGKIADPEAIEPLFASLGKEGFFIEETILEALKNSGDPARDFLLNILKSRPLTQDNERAALALTYFAEDPKVALAAFQELQKEEVRKKPQLASYLIFACEGLQEERSLFEKCAHDTSFVPPSHQHEMQMILDLWKESK